MREQFPQWAELAVAEVPSSGTDNATFRLGQDLVARLPRGPASVPALAKEQEWLPRLEGALPTLVPQLAACGKPSPDYPAPWSINRWIDGEPYREEAVTDWGAFVRALAGFVKSLQGIDTLDGPAPGPHNFGRGAPLAHRDERVRGALAATADWVDAKAAGMAWEEDSLAPAWAGPPSWMHSDIHAQNILMSGGRLHAVLDFGCLGVGDPACELALAWRLLPAHSRSQFRALLAPDDATWRRARAWALSISLMEVQHYRTGNTALNAIAMRTIGEVLKDHGEGTT